MAASASQAPHSLGTPSRDPRGFLNHGLRTGLLELHPCHGIFILAASRFFVGSPHILGSAVSFRVLASAPAPSSWGLCPQTPRICRFAATGTIGHNARAAAEDRALLGSNPFGYAQGRPERRGGAIRHRAARFGVPPGHVSRLCRRLQGGKSQGSGGPVPQVFRYNILGAPTRNPEEP